MRHQAVLVEPLSAMSVMVEVVWGRLSDKNCPTWFL